MSDEEINSSPNGLNLQDITKIDGNSNQSSPNQVIVTDLEQKQTPSPINSPGSSRKSFRNSTRKSVADFRAFTKHGSSLKNCVITPGDNGYRLNENIAALLNESSVLFIQNVSAANDICKRFWIYNQNAELLFEAVELNEPSYACCSPYHTFTIEFYLVKKLNDPNSMSYDFNRPFMTMERQGWKQKYLFCYSCSESCSDGFKLHKGGYKRTSVGTYTTDDKNQEDIIIGSGMEPPGSVTCCAPILYTTTGPNKTISDFKGNFTGEMPFSKVEGPICSGGVTEWCFKPKFTASLPESKRWAGDLAKITKESPKNFRSTVEIETVKIEFGTQSITKSNLNVNEGELDQPALTSNQKATLLASYLLLDYMYFDGAVTKKYEGYFRCVLCFGFFAGRMHPCCNTKIPISGDKCCLRCCMACIDCSIQSCGVPFSPLGCIADCIFPPKEVTPQPIQYDRNQNNVSRSTSIKTMN